MGSGPSDAPRASRGEQPRAYPVEIEYQRLIAAFECTSRQLLPADLAALPHEKIAERLTALRTIMEGR